MPRDLASFRDIHRHDKIVVCGCGSSLKIFESPERFVTVGVNDVGRLFQPKYLMLCNYAHQFKGDRWQYMENSRAEYLFTHLWDLALPHPNVVRFRHGANGGTDFSNPNILHHTNTSTYMALSLAIHMGSRWIGVIGIDYTENHFFGATGRYTGNTAAMVDPQFRKLADAAARFGVKIFNLSPASALTAFPKMDLEDFAAVPAIRDNKTEKPLRVVSYASWPAKGVPAVLARCINTRTPHFARCVWPGDPGEDDRNFEGDIEWERSSEAAQSAIESADVCIVHDGRVAAEHRELLHGKPVLTLAHQRIAAVDTGFVERGMPGAVFGQHQATLPEFRNWMPVPMPVPWWEATNSPGPKNTPVTICYTPANRYDQLSKEHHLYWRTKGYRETLRVLDKVAAKHPVALCVTRRLTAHRQVLAMKRQAHIVIDECVTGSYHLNSLEGLAAACVVVNRMGHEGDIVEMLRRSAGGGPFHPFTYSDLSTLEHVLVELIRRGPESLEAQGHRNRLWLEKNWEFAAQWNHFWRPAIELAMHGGRTALPAKRARQGKG